MQNRSPHINIWSIFELILSAMKIKMLSHHMSTPGLVSSATLPCILVVLLSQINIHIQEQIHVRVKMLCINVVYCKRLSKVTEYIVSDSVVGDIHKLVYRTNNIGEMQLSFLPLYVTKVFHINVCAGVPAVTCRCMW